MILLIQTNMLSTNPDMLHILIATFEMQLLFVLLVATIMIYFLELEPSILGLGFRISI